jgi:hypothetical protein
MKRFLLMIAIVAVCAGCQYLDKEIDQQPSNKPDNVVETELEVDKSEFILDYTAQSVEIAIRANQLFEVKVSAEWITYAIAGSGDRVVLNVSENIGLDPRVTEVHITAGDIVHTVTIEQGAKPETMQLLLEHTSSYLDSPTWGGSNIRGSVDWGDGTTEEYQEGISHDYTDTQKHSAQFNMEGATSFRIERVGEIESVILAL